jgi:hypothetical protein
MKRDLDLVRKLLLTMETSPHGFINPNLVIEGYSSEQIGYHVHLMMQAGLVNGVDITSQNSQSPMAMPTALTWHGHEFLDACRNERVWNKAKERLKSIGGDVPLDIVNAVLIDIMRKQVLGV